MIYNPFLKRNEKKKKRRKIQKEWREQNREENKGFHEEEGQRVQAAYSFHLSSIMAREIWVSDVYMRINNLLMHGFVTFVYIFVQKEKKNENMIMKLIFFIYLALSLFLSLIYILFFSSVFSRYQGLL